MSKTLTPEQRAALRAHCVESAGMGMIVPAQFVPTLLALLDAADERDRLAADLDAMRERLAQGATLPQPVSDAAALHVVALYAILAVPEGAPLRTVAADILGLDADTGGSRSAAVAVELMKLWSARNDPGVIEAAVRNTLADIGRRILAGEG